MIEENARTTARWPIGIYPRVSGIALLLQTRLDSIHGNGAGRVTGVQITGPDGQSRMIECDGVILCGKFTPESSLARCGHLAVDRATGGPVVDQFGRCSDPVYFAAGNILRPVETAAWSWQEGRLCGQWVAQDLAGVLASPHQGLRIRLADPRLKYVMPQQISLPLGNAGMSMLQLRVSTPVSGYLVMTSGDQEQWRHKISAVPERRILLPMSKISDNKTSRDLALKIENRVN